MEAYVTTVGAGSHAELDVQFCPHHPSNTAWWWKTKCPVCASIHNSYITKVSSSPSLSDSIPLSTMSAAMGGLPATQGVEANEINPKDYHPDYRFTQWPNVSAYAVSRFRMPPDDADTGCGQPRISKRDRRHAKAALKYPARFPRKGSDTNPGTFTGKMLLIQREGLGAIGRTIEGSKTTNASGDSWKC